MDTTSYAAPAISAIIISHNDEATIERAVRSVVSQHCPEPFEVIVVASGTDRTAEVVAKRFPEVTLVSLPGTALPGKARNEGLWRARGQYVSFPGSHIELPPGSLAARLRSHRQGHTLVTGAVLNGTHTPAGWAAYFIDHNRKLPGSPPGRLPYAPSSCSYPRALLLEIGGFPENVRTAEDTAVNLALLKMGHFGYRDPAVRIIHHNSCWTPRQLALHFFVRGRGLGRLLREEIAEGGGEARNHVLPRLPLVREYIVRRRQTITYNVWKCAPDRRRTFVAVFPLVMLGVLSLWAGVWYELLRSRR